MSKTRIPTCPELLEDRENQLALLRKQYDALHRAFDEILKDKFAISELRDFWRKRAGVPTKSKEA